MTNSKTTDYRLQTKKDPIAQKGLTLIEVMVAIIIMGLIFGVIITSINAIGVRTRDQQRTTDLHNLQAALGQYLADQTFYPDVNIGAAPVLNDDLGNPQVTVASKVYLSRIPRDPRSTNYCYVPRASFSGGACDNDPATANPPCQSYQLCARFENPPTGATTCTAVCGAGFNWGVNPQNSAI